MGRLRLMAAMLAMLSFLVAGILVMVPGITMSSVLTLILAALCIAAVAPFEAFDRPARVRVFLACAAYSAVAAGATALVLADDVPRTIPAVLLLLVVWGLALTVWAFRTRNRIRRRGWQNYFDA